jgi:hypothetical protein
MRLREPTAGEMKELNANQDFQAAWDEVLRSLVTGDDPWSSLRRSITKRLEEAAWNKLMAGTGQKPN